MGLKKFIVRLSIFMAIMFILDRGFGLVMKYTQEHAKGGYVGHHNYIVHKTNEDVLIFGSSRAIHHYNPQIISDSLDMSCYNCGQDGNGIVLFYGWWKVMKDRYQPKLIIYDVNPEFDLLSGDNIKYLGWLRGEYANVGVKKIFNDVDRTEKYKMLSMMYRYNSKFLQNIIDYIHPIFQISADGYLPLVGDLDKMKIRELYKQGDVNYRFDSLKFSYLESFIKEAKELGVPLAFVASPVWYGKDHEQFIPLEELCEKYEIDFYDFSNDPYYVHQDRWFKDGNHLNANGADEFSKSLTKKLKRNER